MKFRAILTTVAAAMVCCCTLGCPPAEDAAPAPAGDTVETPAAPADGNTTE